MKDDGKPSFSTCPSSKTEENMMNSKQKVTDNFYVSFLYDYYFIYSLDRNVIS